MTGREFETAARTVTAERSLALNFELDADRGEVRYRTSIAVEGDRLTPALQGAADAPRDAPTDTP